MNKTILLASFIYKNELDYFIDRMVKNYNISVDKIFFYDYENNQNKVIVTFKIVLIDGIKINLKEISRSSIIVHKKNTTIYTINALNKLIDTKNNDKLGNIDYKSYRIDWNEYKSKAILLDSGNLSIFTIKNIPKPIE